MTSGSQLKENQHRVLTAEQFQKLTVYLANKYGLRLPVEKKMMLESRFLRRLHALNLSNYKEYLDYVFKDDSTEYQHFIDLVTTHKTFFFREDYQFEFLKKLLPVYNHGLVQRNSLQVWSAGCSTGEEVYTLGMVLNEFRETEPKFDFKIVGTDISLPSLRKASKGIYSPSELSGIPSALCDKYFKYVDEKQTQMIFNSPEVINRIRMGVLNLNNLIYKLQSNFDFIFCRNVIIYFDLKTQQRVLRQLVDKLKPGGYLFLGHSETALGTSLPIKSIRPTIYQKVK